MVKEKKKFESGEATNYISRKSALKKLQLSLKDFRRLCILKGVYPHEPPHPKRVGKGSTEPKTWYFAKDIYFLAHEPIIQKFRQYKIYLRKLKRAQAKKEKEAIERIRRNKPVIKVDHVVLERYPNFVDAIRDLDDCLSLVFLFSRLPQSRQVRTEVVHLCRRLGAELMHYIIEARALRKVFVSIKGIYYQSEIQGETVTWIVPHERGYVPPREVDFKVMATFVDFYTTMLGFVNFRLYKSLGLSYPPRITVEAKDEEDREKVYNLAVPIQRVRDLAVDEAEVDEFPADEDQEAGALMEAAKREREAVKRLQSLFEGSKFFLSREVPREALSFVIRSCGGAVSWDSALAEGAPFPETDDTITHMIVDRPQVERQHLSRWYVQPQWVFDSLNARRQLPKEKYFPGVDLPPHLSPFVQGNPLEASAEDEAEAEAEVEAEAAEREAAAAGPEKKKKKKEKQKKGTMGVTRGEVKATKNEAATAKEELKLREMMIPKKHKRVYKKIVATQEKKEREVKKLKQRRKAIVRAKKGTIL